MTDLYSASAVAHTLPTSLKTDRAEAGRLAALDGLRGIAALSVLLMHIGDINRNRDLAPFAYLAVDLFFMLSGFVLGFAYEAKLLNGMRWRHFMAVRAARFFPALAIGVVLAAAVEIGLGRASHQLGTQALLHLLLLPDPRTLVLFPLNGVLWTLFFEFYVNALHALLVRRLSTWRLMVMVAICGALWAWIAGRTGNWGGGWNWATVAGGAARVGWSYGVGLLLFRLTASGRLRVPVLPAVLPLSAVTLLLLTPKFQFGAERTPIFLFALLPAILLLTAHARVTSVGQRLAQRFGALSYPLYTMHLPLLLIAAAAIGSHRHAPYLWTIAGVLIVIIAAAVTDFYETPVRRWFRRRIGRSPGLTPIPPPSQRVVQAAPEGSSSRSGRRER